ncbi:MAG: hypothetical protein L0Y38_01995 [Methylococcaceae bacterium]|nr:hypothetical protein [Methylococcaceae bacterium]MCI0667014.1 hypothetical protein [Methylococcaceae bacterium]MCI0732576.1 hypothetical protein [Methylococcaceae bacterium]
MTKKQFADFRMILNCSVLGAMLYSSAAIAEKYECLLVQARPVNTYVEEEAAQQGAFPVGGVVLEGNNFGTNPTVYFGTNQQPARIESITRNNDLDSITLKLPEGTGPGTYKLIIQNTTGPFLDNNGSVNPIFCFGSVTVGFGSRDSGS